ncbi:MAG TPA: metallophosphoesterase [Rhodanobacteraceae bacterium]
MARRLAWLTGVVWLYVALRIVAGLPVGVGVRAVVAVVLLLIAEQHWWSSHWFGSLATAELPRGVLVILAWGFTGLFLFALLSVARDVAGGIVFVFVHSGGRWLLAGQVTAALAVVSAAATAFGVWQAVKVPRTRTVHLDLAGLAPAFDGYCIVQLSDLHASRLLTPRWMAAVVARANAQRPDLVVITGDVADGTPAVRAAGVQPLATLRARDGVLAITGNHEYYSDHAGWMRAYRGMGVRVLDNAHVVIRRGDAILVVAGVTDVQARAYGDPVPDLAVALRAAPPGAPVVLLQHRPGAPQANARVGVALQLSGHTHGGQVRGFDLLVARANRGFVSGLYQVGRMQLYVSNGTGLWAGFAIRLGRPSEITRLVLHPASA